MIDAATQALIEDLRWVSAKTYAKFAPHQYVVRHKTISSEVLLVLHAAIVEHGVDETFAIYGHEKTYKYLHMGEFKYWYMCEDVTQVRILNRVPKEKPAPEQGGLY